MSKKLILFLMLALFGSTSFLRADVFEVQIGEGTGTTGYYPFYTLYNYSIAENIYLASEMQEAGMSAGTITSLSYYATNETGNAQQGLSLWMANVTDTELTTTSHITTDMTLVYTGSMTPAIGWNEFEFNENYFDWDGTSNVIVFCQRNNGTWNSTINWQATTGLSFNAMSYKYQDSGAYDVTVANTMNVSTSRPNVIMKGVTSGGGGGGWNPNPNSEAVRVLTEAYRNVFHKDPQVLAIHAGLLLSEFRGTQCGIGFGNEDSSRPLAGIVDTDQPLEVLVGHPHHHQTTHAELSGKLIFHIFLRRPVFLSGIRCLGNHGQRLAFKHTMGENLLDSADVIS